MKKVTYLLLALVSFIAPMFDNSIITEIKDSFVGSIFYNNNLLLKIIF